MKEMLHEAKFIISFATSSCFATRQLLVGFSVSSDGQIRGFPLSISFHYGSPCSYITWGMNNRPVGGRSSETQSQPIDTIIINTVGRGRKWKVLPEHQH
jgi:hypothetical protein